MTRALAHLVGAKAVGRMEPGAEGTLVAVHAARAGHVEQGLRTILGTDGLDALIDGVDGLVPRNAHPAGILALGVRTLHGITQAVGMVAGLHRGDRLVAAAAKSMAGALVALDLDRTTVLHGHPHAALHLAAATAHRADLARGVGAVEHRVVRLGKSRPRGHAEARNDTGRSGNLQEAPAAHAFLHVSLLLLAWILTGAALPCEPVTSTLAPLPARAHRAALMKSPS